MADVSEFAALGSTPIPGDKPAGVESKYETDYETLKTEVGKLDTNPAGVDWRKIVSLGSTLLKDKSKDLQIATYFTAALWNQNSYPGLTAGITILNDMISTYWEDLFPVKKRMRGRIGALDWVSSRVEKMMPGKPAPRESDREGLTAAYEAAAKLEKIAAEKLEGQTTNLSVLTRTIREQLNKVPKPKPKSEPTQAQQQPTQQQSAQPQPQAAPVKKEIDSPTEAKQALVEINKAALKIALQFRKGEPTNPLSYRLLRTTLWSQIHKVPDTIKGGEAATLDQLEKKLQNREFPECIQLAEVTMVQTPLWIDMSFYTFRAMEGMGYTYDDARHAVGQEIACLVLRMPEILERKPASGAPLCSEPAKLWVTNELSGPAKTAAESNGREESFSKAKKLVSRKKLAEAIAILDHGAKSAGDRREKFLWRLHLAQLCVQGGKPNLAKPLLESLDDEATKFRLVEWETELASEVLKLSAQCARAGKDDASKVRFDELYARLSSLDLSAALALDGNK